MFQGVTFDFDAVIAAVKAAGLMNSLCTIQAPSGNFVNGVSDGIYSAVAGLSDIPCMDAVLSTSSIQATEIKGLADIISSTPRHILLDKYYPQLDGLNWGDIGWRVVTVNQKNGITVTYDLLGAERDSQSSQTRLKVRRLSV